MGESESVDERVLRSGQLLLEGVKSKMKKERFTDKNDRESSKKFYIQYLFFCVDV